VERSVTTTIGELIDAWTADALEMTVDARSGLFAQFWPKNHPPRSREDTEELPGQRTSR